MGPEAPAPPLDGHTASDENWRVAGPRPDFQPSALGSSHQSQGTGGGALERAGRGGGPSRWGARLNHPAGAMLAG